MYNSQSESPCIRLRAGKRAVAKKKTAYTLYATGGALKNSNQRGVGVGGNCAKKFDADSFRHGERQGGGRCTCARLRLEDFSERR